jgi:hypothetical protein
MVRNIGLPRGYTRWLGPLPYRGTAAARLWRRTTRQAALAAGLTVLGCALGACSMDVDSMFSRAPSAETTGSIKAPKEAAVSATQLPPEPDLAFTRAAVNEVLTRGRKDASVPWENPTSGARGTVTPIASAYTVDQTPCQDFLASYVKGDKQAWLRGEACRQGSGKWEVRALRPWIGS